MKGLKQYKAMALLLVVVILMLIMVCYISHRMLDQIEPKAPHIGICVFCLREDFL